MYERYVDDIPQVAKDESDCETEEDIVARLKVIANVILEGIEVEEDMPSRHDDNKLPILDMKVHLDKDRFIIYKHYKKEVSSKLVISERSAHSTSGKRSVHVSEMLRRMLNTSRRLDWNVYAAPVLQNYLERMMAAGYNEKYRLGVLKAALAIYDDKVEKDRDGMTLMNRHKGYKKLERRAEKWRKRNNWGTKGGHIAPIIVPSRSGLETPNCSRV